MTDPSAIPLFEHSAYHGTPMEMSYLTGVTLYRIATEKSRECLGAKIVANNHVLSAYLPLPRLLPALTSCVVPFKSPPLPYVPELWNLLQQAVTYSEPMFDRESSPLSECRMCRVDIVDQRHFDTVEHLHHLWSQKFRFSPVGYQLSSYLQYITAHRIGGYINYATDIRGSVKIEYVRRENVDAGFHRGCLWLNGPKNLPVITGSSPIGESPLLTFEVVNASNREAALMVPILSDGPADYGYESMTRLLRPYEMPNEEVGVYISRSNVVGLKFYDLQFWIKYFYHPGKVYKFVPICVIIRWDFYDPVLRPQLLGRATQLPQRQRRSEVPYHMALVPYNMSHPPRPPLTRAPVMFRTVRKTPVTDRLLEPFMEVWSDPTPMQPIPNRPVASEAPNNQLVDRDTPAAEIRDHIDLAGYLTVNNFASRMLAELVGQVQYEEDDPAKSRILASWRTGPGDLQGSQPQFSHNLPSEEEVQPGGRSTSEYFLSAVVPRRAYNQLGLTSSMVRLCNPEWECRYFAYIVGRKTWLTIDGTETDLLILKLNTGTKWALRAGDGRATDWDSLFITGLPGPAVEYLTTIFTKLIFKEQVNVDDMHSSNAPSGAETWPGEPSTSKESEASRRNRHLRHLRTGWKHLYNMLLSNNPDDFEWLTTTFWPSMESLGVGRLDPGQQVLFRKILEGFKLILCKAPPGTGKTSSMAYIISQLCLEGLKKFLYLATTNAAANVAMLHLVEELAERYGGEANIPKNKIVRFLKAGYDMNTLDPRIRRFCLHRDEVGAADEEETSSETKIRGNLLKHEIIVCTLDLAIMDFVCSVDSFVKTTDDDSWGCSVFDMLILDEAANIDLPRTAVVMLLAAAGQIVMLGDVCQLPAFVTNPRLLRLAADESAMEFFLLLGRLKLCCSIVQLVNNYRSRVGLLRPINRIIYHETPLKARDDINMEIERPEEYGLITNNSPISFLHVEGLQERHGVTIYNPHEITATIRLVEQLTTQGVRQETIGVDATYAANAELLREQMSERFPLVKIGCTNVWQGDERDYMIISLTRSAPNEDACGQNEKLGFLSDLRRVTVAVSRSKRANIFICNTLHHLRNSLIVESLRICCRNRAWIAPMSYGVAQYIHMRVCKGEPKDGDDEHDEPSPHFPLFQPL